MNHSIVKASPQVIYENTSMWQSKIFRFKQFYEKKVRCTCKSLSMSHSSHKHAYHSEMIQGYQILSKRSWQTPINQSMSCQSSWAMCPHRGDFSTGEHHATCFAPMWNIRHFKHRQDGWSIFQAYTLLFKINSFHGTWSAFAAKRSLCSSMNAT
jgi:hypothetical protein